MQYQKEDVRKRIVDAAKTEFLRVGFVRTSMLAVSNRAHVPIGNLYRYFSSKAALFDAIVGTAKDKLIDSVQEICAYSGNYEGKGKNTILVIAEAVSSALTEFAKEYGKELKILLEKSAGSEYADFTDRIIVYVKELCKEKLYAGKAECNDFLCELIANNITRGIFRILIECSPEEQRTQLVSLFIFYFNHLEDRL